TREARFLAVNAQSNSSNYGFNRVNEKWPVAHFCVVDELEARLAAHEPEAPIEEVILKLPYSKIIVTRGAQGAIGYGNKEFSQQSALTSRPIDLLGAGDAVLAVVAPFAKVGWSIQDLVHLGNIAGSIKSAYWATRNTSPAHYWRRSYENRYLGRWRLFRAELSHLPTALRL